MNIIQTKLTRQDLVMHLENLLSDEFDSSELVYLTDGELIESLINVAYFYQDHYNSVDTDLEN